MAQSKETNRATARKISIKAVCGEMDMETIIAQKKIDLMDIFGIATRTKMVESDYGQSVRFIGKFRATNLATGEMFESTRLYLPASMEEDLSAAMNNANSAEFALRINVNYDKAAKGVKYYYDAVSLIEPQNSDALELLQARVQAAQKALPAPKVAK